MLRLFFWFMCGLQGREKTIEWIRTRLLDGISKEDMPAFDCRAVFLRLTGEEL